MGGWNSAGEYSFGVKVGEPKNDWEYRTGSQIPGVTGGAVTSYGSDMANYMNGGSAGMSNGWGGGGFATSKIGEMSQAEAFAADQERIRRAKAGYLASDNDYDPSYDGGGSGSGWSNGGGSGGGSSSGGNLTDTQADRAVGALGTAQGQNTDTFDAAQAYQAGLTPEAIAARKNAAYARVRDAAKAAAASLYNQGGPNGADPLAAKVIEGQGAVAASNAMIQEDDAIAQQNSQQQAAGLGAMNSASNIGAGLGSTTAGYESQRYDQAGQAGQAWDSFNRGQDMGDIDSRREYERNRIARDRARQSRRSAYA